MSKSFKKTSSSKPVNSTLGYAKLPVHKWTEGMNLFRFLPQFDDSNYSNFFAYNEYKVYNPNGLSISMALDLYTETALNSVFWTCWNVEKKAEDESKAKLELLVNEAESNEEVKRIKEQFPAYISRLRKESPNYVNLSMSPKVAGLADCKETGALEIVILPGTHKPRKNGKKPKIGAGTKLMELSTLKDMDGNNKYPDICDPEDGATISVTVLNAGTRDVDYTVAYECKTPMSEAHIAHIQEWDQLFNFATLEDLKAFLEKYLPVDLWHEVVMKEIFPVSMV